MLIHRATAEKILEQDSVYLDGNGSGVSISDVTRKVDDYLIRSIREQTSKVGEGDTINDYSDRVQILLGKPGNQDSIDSNIGSFSLMPFNLWRRPRKVLLCE